MVYNRVYVCYKNVDIIIIFDINFLGICRWLVILIEFVRSFKDVVDVNLLFRN